MFPDWMLERFVLGELDAENTQRLRAALPAAPELKARLEALEADSRRTLAQHPAELVERVVERRLSAEPPRRSPLRYLLAALAGVATLLWLVAVPHPAADDVRLKGDGPSLRLFRLGADGPERLSDAAAVHPHDVVQVAFDLSGATHLVVVSIDGAGNATLHFPLDGTSHAPPGLKALPQSFELDDAPGFERFFLVAGGEPLSPGAILDAARRLARGPNPRTAPLSVPLGASSSSVRLDKVNP
jgi:anti-sigma factor RsiW